MVLARMSAVAFAACLSVTIALSARAHAAPPITCELRLGAWCITGGAYEIDRRLAEDSVHDRVWILRGRFRPESKLVILEPNGCLAGESDTQSLVAFQHGYGWGGRNWDRTELRLKSDGTCDLTILFPAYSGDPMEWAMPEGFNLIRPCGNRDCSRGYLGPVYAQVWARHRDSKP